jgi:hypothetical protein
MIRSILLLVVAFNAAIVVHSWSHELLKIHNPSNTQSTRRNVLSKVVGVAFVTSSGIAITPKPTVAATSPEIFTTANGIKYATIKKATGKGSPIDKDIVAIEYTGYLTDGTIFGTFYAY